MGPFQQQPFIYPARGIFGNLIRAIHPTHLSNLTGFGSGSKFGFGNLLRFFSLLTACSVLPPAKLGIGSAYTTLPFPIKKTPYVSLTY
jgi:hypothetical protein